MGQIVSDVTDVLDYKKAKKDASTQRQKILADMAADEKTKTNLVKKALATQRAKFASGGVSNKSSSAGAVLSRLKSETSTPYDEKRQANIEKLRKINVKKPNLLKNILDEFDKLM